MLVRGGHGKRVRPTRCDLHRIERELSLALDSGAIPVVVLTKADLSVDPGATLAAGVQAVALGADVLVTSALAGDGVEPLLRDCTHHDEPGCAVRAAVATDDLPAERLASCHKLIRESQVASMKTDPRLRAEEERKWKIISKAGKAFTRMRTLLGFAGILLMELGDFPMFRKLLLNLRRRAEAMASAHAAGGLAPDGKTESGSPP